MKRIATLLFTFTLLLTSCDVDDISSPSSSDSSESIEVIDPEEELREKISAYLEGSSYNFTMDSAMFTMYQTEDYLLTLLKISTFSFSSGYIRLYDNNWYSFSMDDISNKSSLNVLKTSLEDAPELFDLSLYYDDLDDFTYDKNLDELVMDIDVDTSGNNQLSLGFNDEDILKMSYWSDGTRTYEATIYDINETRVDALEEYIESKVLPTSDIILADFVNEYFGSDEGPNYTLSAEITINYYDAIDVGSEKEKGNFINSEQLNSYFYATKDNAYQIYPDGSEMLYVNSANPDQGFVTYEKTSQNAVWNLSSTSDSSPYWYTEINNTTNLLNITNEEYEEFLTHEKIMILDSYTLMEGADLNNTNLLLLTSTLSSQAGISSFLSSTSVLSTLIIITSFAIETMQGSFVYETYNATTENIEEIYVNYVYYNLGSTSIDADDILSS